MKFKHPLARVLFGIALLIVPICVNAQQTPAPAQALSRQTVDVGDHKVIFVRVSPPVPVGNVMQASLPARFGNAEAEEQAGSPQTRDRVPASILMLSCTIFDHEMTEVRWWHAGSEYRIWSSLDFQFFNGVGSFAAEGQTYSLILGIGDAAAWQVAGPLSSFRALTRPSGIGSWYHIVEQPQPADAAAFADINALHRYYDAHETELKQKHAAAKAAEAARQAYLKAHPPVKQDTLIRFWPIQSVLHQAGASKEGAR